jgi:hypothetical protein
MSNPTEKRITLKPAPNPRYRPVMLPDGGIKFVEGEPHNKTACQCCGKPISEGRAYCWLCALFGGQRRV